MTPFLRLARAPLSLLTSCSAGTGYLLAAQPRDASRFWIPMAGVFFLACGASALNQFQESRWDARMERTRSRPLPSGRIQPGTATTFGIVMVSVGIVLIGWVGGLPPSAISLQPVLLALFSILWYNGFYTYAKRFTPFAAVPGALVGAVPPAIGWTLAGGSLLDPPLWILMVFLFLWQVPHFWLLLLLHGDEYRRAGFPVLTDRIPPTRLRAVVFSWIAAAAALCLLMPLFGLIHGRSLYLLGLAPLPAILCACAWAWIVRVELTAANIRKTFIALNAFALAVMVILTADRLLTESSKFRVQNSKLMEGTEVSKLETRNSPTLFSDSRLLTPNSRLMGGQGAPYA